MSPEGRKRREEFDAFLDKYLVDNLSRNVLLDVAETRPLTEAEQKRLDELNEKWKKLEADSRE